MVEEGALVAVSEVRDAPQSQALVVAGELKSSVLTAQQLADLRKVVTHTKAVGVILPPPDIRAIVDKTAQFVAKNGEAHTHGMGTWHLLGSFCLQSSSCPCTAAACQGV